MRKGRSLKRSVDANMSNPLPIAGNGLLALLNIYSKREHISKAHSPVIYTRERKHIPQLERGFLLSVKEVKSAV